MRILVTGSRTWIDNGIIARELDAIWSATDEIITIVHGACPRGADAQANRWAEDTRMGVRNEPHPAAWDKHGKAAGFRRNAEMVAAGADVCLAFIKDGSRGATHCADLAEKAGIPVRRFLS
jgi:hypothetical protein